MRFFDAPVEGCPTDPLPEQLVGEISRGVDLVNLVGRIRVSAIETVFVGEVAFDGMRFCELKDCAVGGRLVQDRDKFEWQLLFLDAQVLYNHNRWSNI